MKIRFIIGLSLIVSFLFVSPALSQTESSIIQNQIKYSLKTVVVVLSYSEGIREQREQEDETGIPLVKKRGFVNGQIVPEYLLRKKEPSIVREATGTGFVIDTNGYIITNYHVIRNSLNNGKIIVYFSNDKEYEASLVGFDIFSDIAILKIEGINEKFPSIVFANSISVGETVFAIGNPIGLNFSVSKGMVSAVGRYFKREAAFMEYIQTDASINKGNSGGPLFNLQGEVVGINSILVSPQGGSVGLGFAIPSKIANRVAKSIINTGKIQWGGIGLMYRHIPKGRREKYNLKINEGILVQRTIFHKPAEESGIKKDDIILFIDDEPVKTILFPNMIATKIPGTRVKIRGLRNGKEITFNVIINDLSENIKQY